MLRNEWAPGNGFWNPAEVIAQSEPGTDAKTNA
jgi:hypothetical protein